jgi:hypothetical protein
MNTRAGVRKSSITNKEPKFMKMSPAGIDRKIDATLHTWGSQCPEQQFADMTLQIYTVEMQKARDAQAKFELAEVQWQTARQERNAAYENALKLTNGVANSVKGHPKYGENSAVYVGLGYVPTSQRSSGLTRKRNGEAKSNGEAGKVAATEPS